MIRKTFFDAAGSIARVSEFEEYCPCYTDGRTSQAQVGGEDYFETRKQGIRGKSEISRKERLTQADPGSRFHIVVLWARGSGLLGDQEH